MNRPVIVVIAILVQIIADRINRLAGAVVGFLATTVVLVWGINLYSHSQQSVAIFFIPLSLEGFIFMCLLWYVVDVFSLSKALAERQRSKADNKQTKTDLAEHAAKTNYSLETRNLDSLIAAMWENELKTRIKAMDALVKLGDPEAVPRLIEALKSDRWDMRWTAAEALGKLGDPRAIGALQSVLNDENALVRAVAADSLKTLDASPITASH